jgi:hypothetical protein
MPNKHLFLVLSAWLRNMNISPFGIIGTVTNTLHCLAAVLGSIPADPSYIVTEGRLQDLIFCAQTVVQCYS